MGLGSSKRKEEQIIKTMKIISVFFTATDTKIGKKKFIDQESESIIFKY